MTANTYVEHSTTLSTSEPFHDTNQVETPITPKELIRNRWASMSPEQALFGYALTPQEAIKIIESFAKNMVDKYTEQNRPENTLYRMYCDLHGSLLLTPNDDHNRDLCRASFNLLMSTQLLAEPHLIWFTDLPFLTIQEQKKLAKKISTAFPSEMNGKTIQVLYLIKYFAHFKNSVSLLDEPTLIGINEVHDSIVLQEVDEYLHQLVEIVRSESDTEQIIRSVFSIMNSTAICLAQLKTNPVTNAYLKQRCEMIYDTLVTTYATLKLRHPKIYYTLTHNESYRYKFYSDNIAMIPWLLKLQKKLKNVDLEKKVNPIIQNARSILTGK